MTPNDPINVLIEEHRVIEKVLAAFEARLSDLPEGRFAPDFFEQALDFFRDFADACHHGKEEAQLFPVMEQRGVARDGGPIGCMMHEHDFGRSCLKSVRTNLPAAAEGDQRAREAMRDAGLAYVNMLREHIFKEDNILFQMARRALTPADLNTLAASFDANDPRTGPETRARFADVAAALTSVPVQV